LLCVPLIVKAGTAFKASTHRVPNDRRHAHFAYPETRTRGAGMTVSDRIPCAP
jgi:hypothetical protein